MYAFVSSSIRAEPCSLVKVHALIDASGGRVLCFDSRLYLDVPFPTTVAQSQSNAGKFTLSSDSVFLFLHTCTELPTGLAQVRAGTFRAWYLMHHEPQ